MSGVGYIEGRGCAEELQSSVFRRISNPDLVLRLEPASTMRTVFVSVEPHGVCVAWWVWEARTLSDMGIEKEDLVKYAKCCRSRIVRREHSPF